MAMGDVYIKQEGTPIHPDDTDAELTEFQYLKQEIAYNSYHAERKEPKMAQPKAALYRLVIQLDPISKFAEGSTLIEKPIAAQEKEKHQRHEGVIANIGYYAFDKFQHDAPKVGDRVLFTQFAGEFFEDKENDIDYRVVNDTDIVAII